MTTRYLLSDYNMEEAKHKKTSLWTEKKATNYKKTEDSCQNKSLDVEYGVQGI